jgi:hypothetical protein
MRWYGGKTRRAAKKQKTCDKIDKEATIKQQQRAYIKAALGEAIAACQKFPLDHPDMLEAAKAGTPQKEDAPWRMPHGGGLGLPGVAVCTHAHPGGPSVHVCVDATMLIVWMEKK